MYTSDENITWISSGEAAKLLHVSPQTVRDWTAQGKLRAQLTPGGHRQYDAYDIRRVALEERGVNNYWGDDVIVQLRGDGTVTVIGESGQPYQSSAPYKLELRPRHGKDLRQRSELVMTGQAQVIACDTIETVREKGELVAQTYLAVNAFTPDECTRLLETRLPEVIAWLRRWAVPVQGVAAWVSPGGEPYHAAY